MVAVSASAVGDGAGADVVGVEVEVAASDVFVAADELGGVEVAGVLSVVVVVGGVDWLVGGFVDGLGVVGLGTCAAAPVIEMAWTAGTLHTNAPPTATPRLSAARRESSEGPSPSVVNVVPF